MISTKEVAAFVLSFVLALPAFAQTTEPNIAGSSDAEGAQKVLLQAAHDLHGLKSNPAFMSLLGKAKGVIIVPEMVKGAFGFGASGGTGVIVANQGASWSNPAFLTVGSFSFGPQAAWEVGPVFIFPMSAKTLADFTQKSHLFFYGSAGLTVAAWRANAWWPIRNNDLAIWAAENGAYAGLIVAGSDVHDKTIYDKAYYNNKYTEAKEIIASKGDPNANPLLVELQN